MKRNIGSTTLVLIVFAMFVVSMAPSAHARQCSLAGAAGTYGFTVTGTLLLPTGAVPIAGVGRLSINADGSVSGTEGRSVGGVFANETFKGTATINPDCTGTATLMFFESGVLVATSVYSSVVDDNMREERNVQQSLTLPDGTNVPVVITSQTRRIFTNNEQN
jgi:hypothetical protein